MKMFDFREFADIQKQDNAIRFEPTMNNLKKFQSKGFERDSFYNLLIKIDQSLNAV